MSALRLLRVLIGTCRIPVALYMDRHGIFRRNDTAWTVAEELPGRQEPTQVGRALEALGIEPISALSPQAKGRIERAWATLQDRLVAELRLADGPELVQDQADIAPGIPRPDLGCPLQEQSEHAQLDVADDAVGGPVVDRANAQAGLRAARRIAAGLSVSWPPGPRVK